MSIREVGKAGGGVPPAGDRGKAGSAKGVRGAAPIKKMPPLLPLDFSPTVDKVFNEVQKSPEIRDDVVAQTKRKLASGELDKPEALRETAKRLLSALHRGEFGKTEEAPPNEPKEGSPPADE